MRTERARVNTRHRTPRPARAISTLTATALITALAAVAPPTGHAAAPATVPASTAEAATQQAQDTGQPVPLLSETDENSQVVANPDGTFTLTTNREPVRALKDGAWVPIDTTLHVNPDGSLSPAATVEPVAFSGGGTAPLIKVTDGDTQLTLSWPTALPTPTISGDAATYPDVLPGVDLQVTAEPDTYREVLVVHDATAAANPALTQLHLSATAAGLDLTAAPGGGLSATDATGEQVLNGAAPIMWDSSTAPASGPTPTSTDTGTGQVSAVPMSVPPADGADGTATTTLTLTPPTAALTGPGVTYPVYIDPLIEPSRSHFAVVFNSGWHYYDNTSYDLKVGDCPQARSPAECNNVGVGRSYFNFDIHYLSGQATTAHIYTAAVYVDEVHNSAGCTSEPVDLYSAGGISSSTTWAGPAGSKLQEVSANFSDTCASSPPANVIFNNSNVVNQIQTAAAQDATGTTFGLIAPDESNIDQWKRFATSPQLRVTYDFPPSVPTGLDISSKVACSGKPVYTRDSTPTVYAQAHDNNPTAVNVGLWFEIYTGGGTRMRYNPAAVSKPSDELGGWTTNSSNTNSTAGLANGVYDLRVRASALSPDTPDDYSPWTTGHWYFNLDQTAPPAPTITSFDYPAGAWGAPQATPGQFTFGDNGSTDTAGFAYAYDSAGDVAPPTDTACNYNQSANRWIANDGTSSITPPTSLPVGYHTLYVKSFDDAHNVSGQTSYVFYVAPTVLGEGTTKIETESLTPSQPNGQGDPGYNGGIGYPVYTEGPSGIWSNGYQQHLIPSAASATSPARFIYTFQPAATADYALGVEVSSAASYGILAFDLDGTAIAINGTPVTFDAYSASAATHYIQLGGIHVTANTTHTITVKIIGKNPSSTDATYNGTYGSITLTNYHDNGYAAGIDYFTIVPINSVTAANFNAAMNNHGIASDNTTPADIDPSTAHAGLSQQALSTAGFGPGATPTIDGVQFTMPAANTDQTDNIMANGQTIPLPQPVQANNIDLLALSTCGATALSAAIELTVNFAPDADHPDGSTSNSPIPSVPDWLQPPPAPTTGITLAATLPYHDVGTTPDTAHPASIYHLSIPTQWSDRTAQSVTLPNLGSTFTNCANPTLHILAMTTS
jgi:hypothetical protein